MPLDEPWIQTFTGRQFRPLNPRPEDVCIEDIAHSLSLQCRFNGHSRDFYSVAEHSVRVADECLRRGTRQDARAGLLHDAAEAYTSDVPAPVKWNLPDFQALEARVQKVVWETFGGRDYDADLVRQIDIDLLATELRDLHGPPPEPWGNAGAALPGRIVPWPAREAEQRFLERWRELATTN
jgi:uncharacterized protein